VQREVAAAGGLIDRKLAPHAKLIEVCCTRPWPGNVRELRSAVRQAAGEALAAGRDVVRQDDLAATAGRPLDAASRETASEFARANPAEIDRDAVVAALARANNVKSVAARALGLHRTQLYRLMLKFGIVDTEAP